MSKLTSTQVFYTLGSILIIIILYSLITSSKSSPAPVILQRPARLIHTLPVYMRSFIGHGQGPHPRPPGPHPHPPGPHPHPPGPHQHH